MFVIFGIHDKINAMSSSFIAVSADGIVNSFLRDQGSLYDLTRSAALENSLTPDEIEHLSQAVNREAQVRIYAEKGPSGVYDFELVKAADVVKSLNEEYPDAFFVKTASKPDNGVYGEVKFVGETESVFAYEKEKYLRIGLSRLKNVEEDYQFEINKIAGEVEDLYLKIKSQVKNALIDDPKGCSDLLKQANEMVGDEGVEIISMIIKEISESDPYFSAMLPSSMIVDGNPLEYDRLEGSDGIVKGLNTLVRQHDGFDYQGGNLMKIREHIRYVEEEIISDMSQEKIV